MTRDILTSDTPARLLLRWKHVLRFRISADACTGLAQLPDAEDFPDEFPVSEFGVGHLLGEVLGVAALKLFRVSGTSFLGERSLDDLVGRWLHALACVDRTTDIGRLSIAHRVVDLGLYAPERLHVLNARLDALGNDDLHRMAMDAVQGRRVVPDVFEGLME